MPTRIGALTLGGVEIYPDKEYGVRIRYYDDDIKADVYLYDLNISELPQDIYSPEMLELFKMAYSEIMIAAHQCVYLSNALKGRAAGSSSILASLRLGRGC